MKMSKADKHQIDMLIKILSRAKVELTGVEVVVAADAMRWLSHFQKKVEGELNGNPQVEMKFDEQPISEEIK